MTPTPNCRNYGSCSVNRYLVIGALHLAGRVTPPKPLTGPAATRTGHSPFSDSYHDLGTAVSCTLTVFRASLYRPTA